MCLYPKLILNPKYKANKKNGGIIPQLCDNRVKYVPIGCQRCIECTKQKARSWQARILEHIKTNTNGKFITLTFSNQSFQELSSEIQDKNGYDLDNAIATLAVRRFLERWRKKYGKSLQHWLVTELGQNGTENIHLHGIIWTNENLNSVENLWHYGHIWKGKQLYVKSGRHIKLHLINYVNQKTATYVTKYVSKIDQLHKTYNPKILCSPGIGNQYTNSYDAKANKFNGRLTRETYRTSTGHKIALPIYWRNKIYTEQAREQLWLYKLDSQTRWICGEKISVATNYNEYDATLKWHQARNLELGYGGQYTEQDWSIRKYENERRQLLHNARIRGLKRFGNIYSKHLNSQHESSRRVSTAH